SRAAERGCASRCRSYQPPNRLSGSGHVGRASCLPLTPSPLLIAAVAAALTLGACGGSDDGSGSGTAKSQEDKAFEGALKFAKCMRDHGIDMPDPKKTAGGGIKQTMKIGRAACRGR